MILLERHCRVKEKVELSGTKHFFAAIMIIAALLYLKKVQDKINMEPNTLVHYYLRTEVYNSHYVSIQAFAVKIACLPRVQGKKMI